MKKKVLVFLAGCFGISLLAAGLFHITGGISGYNYLLCEACGLAGMVILFAIDAAIFCKELKNI